MVSNSQTLADTGYETTSRVRVIAGCISGSPSEVGTPSTEEATGLTIPFFGGSRFAKLCIFRSPGIAVGHTLFFCAPKRLYEMN